MKIVKWILIVIVTLIAIPLITALFVRKDYHTERKVVIEQPVEMVFDYAKLLKNQDNFSVWAKMDPDMQKTYTGTDGEVGFVSAWESTNPDVGRGEQKIVDMVENERIDYELIFLEPWESVNDAYLIFNRLDKNETEMTWGLKGRMPYPFNLMYLFMDFDTMLGKDLTDGLNNLKDILENMDTPSDVDIEPAA